MSKDSFFVALSLHNPFINDFDKYVHMIKYEVDMTLNDTRNTSCEIIRILKRM